jgi:hypothetical protein
MSNNLKIVLLFIDDFCFDFLQTLFIINVYDFITNVYDNYGAPVCWRTFNPRRSFGVAFITPILFI